MGTGQVQGQLWGARAQDWAEVQEPAWQPLFADVMALAEVRPGRELFDCGCGAGGALVVARQFGGNVTGLDASAALVAIARERLPGARIEVGEMEELPFEERSFDIVTGINSFQFAGDLPQALKEVQRVLKPAGRVLMLVWGPKEDCELISATMPAILALLPSSSPGISAPPPLPLSKPGVMEELMDGAGLSPAAAGSIVHALTFADLDTACRAHASAAPCIRAAAHAGEAAVFAALRNNLKGFVKSNGSVEQKNSFRYVIARRR